MTLNFQQVRDQVKALGSDALSRAQELRERREIALQLLHEQADEIEALRRRVEQVVEGPEQSLRCALPVHEALDACFPRPPHPEDATILAIDGSQILPDRNAPVNFSLINIGAIWVRQNSPQAPCPVITSELLYGQALYTPTGRLTEDLLTLRRDLNERRTLTELAGPLPGQVITFTDGPMELWGAKDSEGGGEFQKSLQEYLESLRLLASMGVATAGYVDKPGANLVVRLLEISQAGEKDFPLIRTFHPFQEVTDLDLYKQVLLPGGRSAVFAMQSQSAKFYEGPLALHFFYLNVGRPGHPWLARVEIPEWVANNPEMLDNLHAVLVHQCEQMGNRPYPYLLHRAHETAVVSMEEKDQVTQMILLELRKQGAEVGEESNKQAHKGLPGRTAYKG